MQRTPPKTNCDEGTNTNALSTFSKRSLRETSPDFPPNKLISDADNKLSVGSMSVASLENLIKGSMSTLLDDKLKDMPTKTDLEGIVAELHILQQKNVSLQHQMQKMESRCISLERQVEWLSKKANEKNIVVHVPAESGIVAADRAKTLCLDLLKTQNTAAISSVRSLKSRNPKIENIIVELRDREDVGRILQSATTLRNTGISIHRDYPAAAREKRRRVVQLRNEIITKNPGIKIQLRGETLKIQNKTFYFDVNNNLSSDDEGGMSYMEQLRNTSDRSAMSSIDRTMGGSGPSGSQTVERNERIQRF